MSLHRKIINLSCFQQIWICLECKKKQDTLLKSGQWLKTNPTLQKKLYTSDYILNKAAAIGIGMRPPTDSININQPNEPNQKSSLKENTMHQASLRPMTSTTLPRRILPTISKSVPTKTADSCSSNLKPDDFIQQSNSAQSVPELSRDYASFDRIDRINESIKSQNLSSHTTRSSTINNIINNTDELINKINDDMSGGRTLPRRGNKLRQTLIKQASLNQPPSYLRSEYDESSLYENAQSKTKSFTSNQELCQKMGDAFVSSPASSNSQLNMSIHSRTSSNRAERIQDPMLLLKNLKNTSRINSASNLSSIDTNEPAINTQSKHETANQKPVPSESTQVKYLKA